MESRGNYTLHTSQSKHDMISFQANFLEGYQEMYSLDKFWMSTLKIFGRWRLVNEYMCIKESLINDQIPEMNRKIMCDFKEYCIRELKKDCV